MHLGKVDGRNPNATKKGPGRKHSQHHQKGGRSSDNSRLITMAQAHAMASMMGSQTDNVTNTPLKSATRGG
jgi:hypothetical protein